MIVLLLLAATAARLPAAPDPSTRDGLVARYTAMFRHIDSDGDGRISPAEWETMVDASPMLQSQGLSPSQRAGLRAALMAGFADADSDKDNSLTLDELMAKPLVRFACLDANHDGRVSEAETAASMDRCAQPAGVAR